MDGMPGSVVNGLLKGRRGRSGHKDTKVVGITSSAWKVLELSNLRVHHNYPPGGRAKNKHNLLGLS